MAEKVFNKKLEHRCEYCIHGNRSGFSDEIICRKRGVTDRQDACRSYKYDPLKREPKGTRISDNYNPEDFVI
ncbi:MAG: hypothetical protein IKD04_00010 [Clostridia bacterium]|nr:hypothetical protein [Clostridia bacterium]